MSAASVLPSNVDVRITLVAEMSEEVATSFDEMEAQFQKELEEEGRGEGGWSDKFHCLAQGYLSRPRVYNGGRDSHVFEAVRKGEGSEETRLGAYVLSSRKVFFEGQEISLCYGYFARILPIARGQGLNVKFYTVMTNFSLSLGHTFGLAVIARENVAALKGQLRSNPATGYDFFGEQVLYVLPTQTLPENQVSGAVLSELSDPKDVETLFSKLYGTDGFRLADPGAVMGLKQHGGHFLLRNGDSAAGVSLWRPDYALLAAPNGEQRPYTLYYNLWAEGEEGEALMKDLLQRLLHTERNPYAIVILMRYHPSKDIRPHELQGIPSYEPNPFECFVRSHALGFEEELILGGFLSFSRDQRRMKLPLKALFFDPRDISSLLCFQSVSHE